MSIKYAVQQIDDKRLRKLLLDHTTGKNIIWATDDYSDRGDLYGFSHEITLEAITGIYNSTLILPRVYKAKESQLKRTKGKAEVFTPSWICNAQNNLVDTAWFGRENVFNTVSHDGKSWTATSDKIKFPRGKSWQDYVKANRLEISCGEAPYLVSRYDTVTGDDIPLNQRVGLLDRKLRIVSENTKSLKSWLTWAECAFKATYGFEYQGDSLLIGRINLLKTFQDYLQDRIQFFGESRAEETVSKYLDTIATIISLNLWQMDGLTYTIPGGKSVSIGQAEQMFLDFGDDFRADIEDYSDSLSILAKVKDWETGEYVSFQSLVN